MAEEMTKADWKEAMEGQIENVFGRRMWHSYMRIQEKWACYVCAEQEIPMLEKKRALVNVWGSVCDVPMCDKHYKEYHGKCMDEIPREKPAKKSTEG